MATSQKRSNFISSQVPSFVRREHPNFVAFLEAYYEYLEQSSETLAEGKAVEREKNLINYFDIDKTLDDFAEKLYQHFLLLIPQDVLADRKLLIKHIQDFYRAKGTEKSYKFLINILYGKELDFYYPKVDILKASDGKWFVESFLSVSDITYKGTQNNDSYFLNQFQTRKIYGNTTNSQAVVYKTDRTIRDGIVYSDLYISDIKGSFAEGEHIYAKILDEEDSNVYLLSANVRTNGIYEIIITDRGSLYNVGDYVSFSSAGANGINANAYVSLVSDGEVYDLIVSKTGAGFQVNNTLRFTSTTGNGAAAVVTDVNDNNYYHPNTYNLISSTISVEANTPLNNAIYSNLNTTIVSSPNANSTLISALNTFTLTGLGPITDILLTLPGSKYVLAPTVDVTSNTILRELGILGKMQIVNGGSNYVIGDIIEFINYTGFPGFGASANVTNVSATGKITEVKFKKYNDEMIGGSGYIDTTTLDPKFPKANVVSATGNGAIIRVIALMGDGEQVTAKNDVYGAIQRITINNRGSGYITPPTINLSSKGDGTATAYTTLQYGKTKLAGRYLNEDGFLSSYNFLENRDYYQNYSYVLILKESINKYGQILKNLVHPSGTIMFGEYDLDAKTNLIRSNITVNSMEYTRGNIGTFSYIENDVNLSVILINHQFSTNDNVYIDFIDTSELENKYYQISNVINTSVFTITTETTFEANANGKIVVYAQ